ncbi:FUSC family protein [Sphingomonadaceae bacterium jetA1]|uniref:FUSC family protein n=1 Tax=Facivitalis istanbulensis TaxID=3075838 RepID=UPI00347CCB84
MNSWDAHRRQGHLARQGRGIARWLELRAIAMMPGQFDVEAGLRGGVIVAGPLLGLLISHDHLLAWAIFAAFWTCLADGGGPIGRRRTLLAGFAGGGTAIAFLGTWIAGWGQGPALTIGAALVFVSALMPLWWRGTSVVATLIGVVAVVAAGYPMAAGDAARLALCFLAGSSWALLILTLLWRGDEASPPRRAVASVFACLADMARDLSVHRPATIDPARYGQHRRAVRIAIERARTQLASTGSEDAPTILWLGAMLTRADDAFHAMLALDHLRSPGEAAHDAAGPLATRLHMVERLIRYPKRSQPPATPLPLNDTPVSAGAIRTAWAVIDDALTGPFDAPSASPPAPVAISGKSGAAPSVLGHALRTAMAVLLVTVAARLLHLQYPYWTAMAVVVVLSPARRQSVSRGIERIIGSVVGGALAVTVLHLTAATPAVAILVLFATIVTLALRPVNYTLFVSVLTLLFVLVMHLLHPVDGIVTARMVDNVLGSIVAIGATLLLMRGDAVSTGALVDAAVDANRAYLTAIASGDPAAVATARRAAGLASCEAEIAVHAPDRLFGATASAAEREALSTARRLAGEAAVAWHDRNPTTRTSRPEA